MRTCWPSEADVERITWMCSWHFGGEDWGVESANIRPLEVLAERNDKGTIVAFVAFKDDGSSLIGRRSGVLRAYRGKGLATKMYRHMTTLARRRGLTYRTYCSAHNLPSLNSHLLAGMRIRKTWYDDGNAFVDLESREVR